MDSVESCAYMTECLKEWNYPDINAMDQTQLTNVFSIPNRQFLVSWLLNRLFPDSFLPNITYDSNVLADFICEVGYCTSKQKQIIFSREFSQDQITILHKMFYFAKMLSEPVEHTSVNKVTIKEIEELTKMDLNLFPQYGPLKVVTSFVTEAEWEDFKQRLENVVQLLDSTFSNKSTHETEEADLSDTLISLGEEFQSVLEDLNNCLPEFVVIANEFNTSMNIFPNESIDIDENAGDIIKRAAESMKKMSQHLIDIKTITEFVTKSNINLGEKGGDNNELIKKLVIISKDVLNTARQLKTKLID